ncbi:MAG: insulinase family protein [Pseudomonadales bacterium]|nr:insulinase family protein [Pseudomonadales bacterium]
MMWLASFSVYAISEKAAPSYQQALLTNGVKLATFSNPKLEKNYIALRVNAGSLHEPLGFPGLAHLLEHLVFNHYLENSTQTLRQWIQSKGGQQNAHTNLEDTLYFFEVPSHVGQEALQHWSNALRQVNINQAVIKEELKTLSQEFVLKAQRSNWQYWDTLKALTHSEHPFKRLHPGNTNSLSQFGLKELSTALANFQTKHYQSNRITLAISGPQPAKTLIDWGKKTFQNIPAGASQNPVFGKFIDHQKLPAALNIESNHHQVLTLLFTRQGETESADHEAFNYLRYLVQYPGENGLLHELRTQGLVTSLTAGAGISSKEQNTFHITLQASEIGWQNPDKIKALVFQYLELVKQQALADWRIREFENLSRLHHLKTMNDWTPMDVTLRMTEHFETLDELLDTSQLTHRLPKEFADRFAMLLNEFIPQNLITIYMDSKINREKSTSPVFNTAYKLTSFANTSDTALVLPKEKAANRNLQLPSREPLIPRQWKLPIATNPNTVPKQILSDKQLEIWHGFDNEWNTPIAQVKLLFKQPLASSSVEQAVMTEILLVKAKNHLSRYHERLENLGYGFQLARTSEGIMMNIGGFTETLSELIGPIIAALQNPQIEQQTLTALSNQLKRKWQTESRYGFEELFDHLHARLLPRQWSKQEMIRALDKIDLQQLQKHRRRIFPAHKITGLFYGRINPAEVLASVQVLRSLSENQRLDNDTEVLYASLKSGKPDHFKIATWHSENALIYYHQALDSSPATTGKVYLLRQLLHPRFFQTMRTDQKLGYAVFVAHLPLYDRAGFALTVQSPTTKPDKIREATERFMIDFDNYLSELDSVTFDNAKLSLQQALRWQAIAPQKRVDVFWQHIRSGSLRTAQLLEQGELITKLTLADIRHYFRDHVIGKNSSGVVLTSEQFIPPSTSTPSPLL